VRAPGDGSEKVRAAAAGDPAAAAALWDAHGPRLHNFCRRVLGDGDDAADAAQDAFLLALKEESAEDFGVVALRAARQTSFELLAAGRGADPRPGTGLSAATGRLRPQQRAALALASQGLSYAELATVLGIGVEAVPALLARARLRLHDELHGTALAAAAVRSPDCEDVVPLLAAAADGQLDAVDAAWADPHVLRCPICPRTRRAMLEAAATYAAWSSAAPPSWLRAATLADVGAEAQGIAPVPVAAGPPPARRGGRRAAGAWATPKPGLPVALLGAMLLTAAFAALVLAATGALRQGDSVRGGAQMTEKPGSVQVASVPAPRAQRPAARRAPRRASPHVRHVHKAPRSHGRSTVAVAVVHRVPTRVPSPPPSHRVPARQQSPAARPKRTRKPRPTPAQPAPPTPAAPIPASPEAPADESPASAAADDAAPETPPATAPQAAAPVSAPKASTVGWTPTPKPDVALPKTEAPASAPSLPAGQHWRRGDRDERSHGGPCQRGGRHGR
jgi:DNA-directed RNA polymerase specialized sigma24 family protein